MHVLITGVLWRDPVARQSNAGKQFVTALIKAGAPADATWANIIAFDTSAQSELLRLQAGDALSVQGTAKLSIFEKAGEHRASLEVTAAHVLALRQPPKPRKPSSRGQAEIAAPATAPFDDDIAF